MNFGGHVVGGVVAGSIAGVVGVIGMPSSAPGLFEDVNEYLGQGGNAVVCFGAALLMSLFPDLDTASVPQRWYLRLMFAALVLTALAGWMEVFVVLALVALLPMLHKHRGWTHWPITPWLVAGFLAVAHENVAARNSWLFGFSWENVWELLLDGWPFVFACVLGHYTHLLLDSRKVRWLPFVQNGPGHH